MFHIWVNFFLEGEQSLDKALEKIIPADLSSLKLNQSKYSFLLNDNGGIIDDLICYKKFTLTLPLVINIASLENSTLRGWERC